MASKSSRKKKYSRDELPTQWSEWAWAPEKFCWSRYRLDIHGQYEFEDGPTQTQESSSTPIIQDPGNPEIPRYAPPHDATQVDSGQTAFATSPEYTFESTTAAFEAMNLDKGKEREHDIADPSSNQYPASAAPPIVAPNMHTTSPAEERNYNMARSNSIYAAQYPQDSGGSSSQQPYYSSSAWQNNTANSNYYPQPQQQSGENYIGPNTPALESPLDSRFYVHHGSEFKFGMVFKILWAEPTGINGTQLTEPVHSRKFREKFTHKIRYFVVVKIFKGQAHCLCLPIQTYNRRATTKSGAQAQDHAVIYSEKPVTYQGESLTKKSIRVDMTTPREKLAPESRLNYAKVYTIEFNVKVFFIGRVHRDHRHQVLADYHNTMGMGNDQDDGYQEPESAYGGTSGTDGPSQ